MKKILGFLFSISIASTVFSGEYAGGLTVLEVRLIGTTVMFGTTPQPQKTCSNYGEYIMFSIESMEGKFMYNTLVTAKAHNKKISVWYEPSLVPGTDHTNGCGGSNIATLYGIALP